MAEARRRVTPVSVAVPGRARFRVEGLRGYPGLAHRIEESLAGEPDVHRVQASPVTGTVLILFEPRRVRLRDLISSLRRAWQTRAGTGPHHVAPAPPWAHEAPWHVLSRASIIRRLQSSPITGLTTADARARLAWLGPNRVPAVPGKSTGQIVLEQLTSMPVLLLGVAAALSVLTGGLVDAVVILVVVLLNTGIGSIMESRAERAIAALTTLTPPQALVRRHGLEQALPASELVPGDLLVLKTGYAVPADARLLSATGLIVNEAALTGESYPVTKAVRPLPTVRIALADRTNMVYAGTVVAEGSGVAMVTATGRATEVGRIRALVGEAVPPVPPLVRELDAMGQRLLAVSLGLSGVALGLGLLRGVPFLEMLRTAIALAVAAVPEGLPAVATTTLALGMQRMRRQGALVRRLAVVESLGSVTVICVDKTGTITENRMTVQEWFVGGHTLLPPAAPRAAEPLPSSGSVAPPMIAPTLRRALEIAVLCNEAELESTFEGRSLGKGSATELALLTAARDAGLDDRALRRRFPRQRLEPRRESQNWMGTVHDVGPHRQFVAVKGAPEAVLRLSNQWHDGLTVHPLTREVRRAVTTANAQMAERGMRVLALAYAEHERYEAAPYDNLVWAGLVGLADPIRPGVRQAIAACHRAGIRVVMLTGDQPLTARAIARQLADPSRRLQVFDASRLAAGDTRTLAARAHVVDVFARVSPVHKYEIVRALQAAGEVVAMTGDGINDAPALRMADVGIALGSAGTAVAREVADVVLADDNFTTLVEAIAHGRTIYANTGKAVRFLLATNLSEILVTLGALAGGIARPLRAIQFLWINLLSDVFPALALAVEPTDPTVMTEPPRDPAASMLSSAVLRAITRDAATLSAVTLAAYAAAATRHGVGARSSTVAFSTLTAGQLLHALTCRSEHRPGLSGLPASPALLGALGGTLGLTAAAVTVPFLRRLLQTTPLSGLDVVTVATAAGLPLLTHELRTRTVRPEAGTTPRGGQTR
jgi:P-type Ca2+ transporter type 2C